MILAHVLANSAEDFWSECLMCHQYNINTINTIYFKHVNVHLRHVEVVLVQIRGFTTYLLVNSAGFIRLFTMQVTVRVIVIYEVWSDNICESLASDTVDLGVFVVTLIYRVPTLPGKPWKPWILSFTFPGLENAWNLLKNCENVEF